MWKSDNTAITKLTESIKHGHSTNHPSLSVLEEDVVEASNSFKIFTDATVKLHNAKRQKNQIEQNYKNDFGIDFPREENK